MIDIDKLKEARRRRITEEIKDAMQKQGLSRKDLAGRMGRSPSEVTRWLSGGNNFTSDLLTELSEALGTEISGTYHQEGHEAPVCGYSTTRNESSLHEPAAYMSIEIPNELFRKISRKASGEGQTIREYICRALSNALEESDTPLSSRLQWLHDNPVSLDESEMEDPRVQYIIGK